MTWLKFINVFILQFFFIRLQKTVHNDGRIEYAIIRWIWPFTGWFTDYIYIFKRKEKVKYKVINSIDLYIKYGISIGEIWKDKLPCIIKITGKGKVELISWFMLYQRAEYYKRRLEQGDLDEDEFITVRNRIHDIQNRDKQ